MPVVKWLKVPPQKFDFLSFEEAERLVRAADTEWRAAILVGLRCGLRLGEIMALRWEDVDLITGRLVVNRTVSRGRIGSPKSETVPIDSMILITLGDQLRVRELACDALCYAVSTHDCPDKISDLCPGGQGTCYPATEQFWESYNWNGTTCTGCNCAPLGCDYPLDPEKPIPSDWPCGSNADGG